MMPASRDRQNVYAAVTVGLILIAVCLAFLVVANYGIDFIFPRLK